MKIRLEERLAATSELNLAPSPVTGCCEAKGMGYWAVTEVKGLSLEICIVSVADVLALTEGSTLIAVDPNLRSWNIAESSGTSWRGDASPTGSETMAQYQRDIIGTREAQSVLLREYAGSSL